jgi:hypothetical protein
MVFILANDGRDDDHPGAERGFERYESYLAQNRDVFPPRAYALATSDWFYDPRDHRCPHDARLERLQLVERPGADPRRRTCSLSLRLLGAYQDGCIEISYPTVYAYSLQALSNDAGSHGDWRYDEFRISERGHLVHEIEWAYRTECRAFVWTIEADDFVFEWIPK